MVSIKFFVIHVLCISILGGISNGLQCYKKDGVDDSGPVVETKTGTIVGKYIKVLDEEVPAFLGIPYAKPPVGEKRFKISEPIDSWNGILTAKEKSATCMQYSSREEEWLPPPTFNFSEDCLYLNVWLPPNCCCNRKDKLPVMVFTFGGGYFSGSAMMDVYDGGVFTTYGDVVFAIFNYRLGIFGFLNAHTKEAPGNMGLYDQLLALQWVHKNIENFGGDPNKVTLFGEGSGSFLVSLQMVSPFSQNLFQKVILESGTATQPLVVDNVNSSLSKAIQFSELAGCSIDSSNAKSLPNDILHCLKNKSSTELVITENYFTSKFPAFFSPSYGNDCEDCLKYFLKSPKQSIQSGEFPQMPILIGNNRDEGTIFLTYTLPRLFRFDQKTPLTIPVAKQVLRDFFNIVQSPSIPSDSIFNYYMENIVKDTSDALLRVVSMIYGDFIIKCSNMILADNAKDVYYYFYSHRSKKDKTDKWLGNSHYSEVPYVFGNPIKDTENYTSEDKKISEDIIQKFTSFANYGYPVTKDSEPDWPKYSSSNRQVYELNYKKRSVFDFPSQKACEEIWKPIFIKINNES